MSDLAPGDLFSQLRAVTDGTVIVLKLIMSVSSDSVCLYAYMGDMKRHGIMVAARGVGGDRLSRSSDLRDS